MSASSSGGGGVLILVLAIALAIFFLYTSTRSVVKSDMRLDDRIEVQSSKPLVPLSPSSSSSSSTSPNIPTLTPSSTSSSLSDSKHVSDDIRSVVPTSNSSSTQIRTPAFIEKNEEVDTEKDDAEAKWSVDSSTLQSLTNKYHGDVCKRLSMICDASKPVFEYLSSIKRDHGREPFANPILMMEKGNLFTLDVDLYLTAFNILASDALLDKNFRFSSSQLQELIESLSQLLEYARNQGKSEDVSLYENRLRYRVSPAFLRLLLHLHIYSPEIFKDVSSMNFSTYPIKLLLDDVSVNWLRLIKEEKLTEGSDVTKVIERAEQFKSFCKSFMVQFGREMIGFDCLTHFKDYNYNEERSYVPTLLFVRYWQFVTIYRKHGECCKKLAAKVALPIARFVLALAVHFINDDTSVFRLNGWSVLLDILHRHPRLVIGKRLGAVDSLARKFENFVVKQLRPKHNSVMRDAPFTSESFVGRFPSSEDIVTSHLYRYLLVLTSKWSIESASPEFDVLDTKFVHRFEASFVTNFVRNLLAVSKESSKLREENDLSDPTIIVPDTTRDLRSSLRCFDSDLTDYNNLTSYSFTFLYMIYWNFHTFFTINQFDRPLAAIKDRLYGMSGSVSFVSNNLPTSSLLASEALYAEQVQFLTQNRKITRRYDSFAQDFNDVKSNEDSFWSSNIRSYSFVDNDYGTLRASTIYSLYPSFLEGNSNTNDPFFKFTYQNYVFVYALLQNFSERRRLLNIIGPNTTETANLKVPDLVTKESFQVSLTMSNLLKSTNEERDESVSALLRLSILRDMLYKNGLDYFVSILRRDVPDFEDFFAPDNALASSSSSSSSSEKLSSVGSQYSEMLFLYFVISRMSDRARKQIVFFMRVISRSMKVGNVYDYLESSHETLRSIVSCVLLNEWLDTNFESVLTEEEKRHKVFKDSRYDAYSTALRSYVDTIGMKQHFDKISLASIELTLTSFETIKRTSLPSAESDHRVPSHFYVKPHLTKVILGNKFFDSWRELLVAVSPLTVYQTFHEIPDSSVNIHATYFSDTASEFTHSPLLRDGDNESKAIFVTSINFSSQRERSSSVRFFRTSTSQYTTDVPCIAEIDCVSEDPTIMADVIVNQYQRIGQKKKHTVFRISVRLNSFTILNYYYPRFIVNSGVISNRSIDSKDEVVSADLKMEPSSMSPPSLNSSELSNLYATENGTCFVNSDDYGKSETYLALNISNMRESRYVAFLYPNVLKSHYAKESAFYVNSFRASSTPIVARVDSRRSADWSVNSLPMFLSSSVISRRLPNEHVSLKPSPSSQFRPFRFVHRVRRKLSMLPW